MKTIFFLFFLILSATTFSQEGSKEDQWRYKLLTEENHGYYLSKHYEVGKGSGVIYLEFILEANHNYLASYSSGGASWEDVGRWELINGAIELHPLKCVDVDGNNNCDKSLGDATVRVTTSDSNLYYSEFLEIRSPNVIIMGDDEYNTYDLSFGVPGKELLNQEKRKWKGKDVVAMGLIKGITTSDVKIRATPDVNGEIELFWKEMGADEMDYVPKGQMVEVIARTPGKIKVQKWENYWYLVNVGSNQQVWIFGEFIKFN